MRFKGDKMNILEKITDATKKRVEKEKFEFPISKMKFENNTPFRFEESLRSKPFSFICEVKKASPSKGIISNDFPYLEIAKKYEKSGASAISVLTEPDFFLGSNSYLSQIKNNVNTPILRKDFIIDEYQIYQSSHIGADAILLICAILSDEQLQSYYNLAHKLGLSVLVETHSKEEIQRAVKIGAKIIGVNNRNLADFSVDINHSINLKQYIPDNVFFISESGIKTVDNIKTLKENGVNGVLIGETLMKSDNLELMMKNLNS